MYVYSREALGNRGKINLNIPYKLNFNKTNKLRKKKKY